MDETREGRDAPVRADEPPPFGGSWGRLYALVITTLALLVAAFAFVTRHFA
ncbi:MAG: hypothetical protein HYU52_01295 [Acidobacteria bacterium]|nr:hypothetical protein [Acidobacteriota bacterium]